MLLSEETPPGCRAETDLVKCPSHLTYCILSYSSNSTMRDWMVGVRRRILLECFVVMCSIDRPVISLLLSSVLPLEVAQVHMNTPSRRGAGKHEYTLWK